MNATQLAGHRLPKDVTRTIQDWKRSEQFLLSQEAIARCLHRSQDCGPNAFFSCGMVRAFLLVTQGLRLGDRLGLCFVVM